MYPVNPLTPNVLNRHCGKMVCAVTKDGRRVVGRLKSCNDTHIFVADERRNQYRPCRAYKSNVLETGTKTAPTKKKKNKNKKANVKIKGFYPYGGYGGYGYGGGWGDGWGWALGLSALALLFLI